MENELIKLMLKFYYENFLFVRTDYMLLLNGLQDTHYKATL